MSTAVEIISRVKICFVMTHDKAGNTCKIGTHMGFTVGLLRLPVHKTHNINESLDVVSVDCHYVII